MKIISITPFNNMSAPVGYYYKNNAKIVTNERKISSLLEYFSKRVQAIFAGYGKDIHKRAKKQI